MPKPRRPRPNPAQDPTKIAYWTTRGLDITAARGHAEGERKKRGLPPLPSAIPAIAPKPKPVAVAPIQTPLQAITGGKAGHDPLKPHAQTPAQVDRRAAVILRRQQLLRNLGLLQTAPDGIWGPKSQKAWSVYVYRRRHGGVSPVFKNPVADEKAAAAAAHRQDLADRQRQLQQETARRIEVMRRMKLEAGFTTKEATPPPPPAAKPEPGLARGQAAKLAQDDAERERQHLLAQGQKLRADATGAAGLDLHTLTRVITNGDLKFDPTRAADTRIVQTWLSTHGHPEVHVDGQWGKKTNDALTAAFHAQRRADEAKALATVTHDFYGKNGLVVGTRPEWWPLAGTVPAPGELLKLLQAGSFSSAVLFRQLTEHSQFGDLGFKRWRDHQLASIQKSLHNGVVGPGFLFKSQTNGARQIDILQASRSLLDQRAQAQLDEQIKALIGSRTAEEFGQKITGALARAEIAYQAKVAERLHHKRSAWGKLLHYAQAPGEFLRTAGVADAYKALDFFDGGSHTMDSADYWEQAQLAIHESNPFLKYGYEFLADPLVYARPFRLTSTIVRGLRGSEALGAYAIRDSASLFKLGNKALYYREATWHLPIKASAGSAIRSIPGVDKALRLKEVAVDHGATQVAQAARHMFRPGTRYKTGGESVPHFGAVKSGVTARVRESGQKVIDRIDQPIPLLSKLFREQEASIYMTAGREVGIYSNVGASVVGRYAEEVRVQSIVRLVHQASRQVYIDAKAAGLSEERAIEKALAEWDRIKDVSGVFIEGGGDPLAKVRLTNKEGRTVEASALDLIEQRTHHLLQQFEEVVLPRFQDHLEQFATASGRDLFDKEGKWAARHGEAAQKLREEAAATFEDDALKTIPNARYNIPLDHGQYIRAVEGEIRRRTSRVVAYKAREEVGGKAFTEDWLPNKIGEIRRDVENHFKQQPDGKWLDTRKELEVSALYARNVESALTRPDGKKLVELFKLAEPPLIPGLTHSPIDAEIAWLAWDLGGAHSDIMVNNIGVTHPAHRFLARSAKQQAKAQEFVAAVGEHHLALARAIDHAMPHAMRNNWALMVALSKAQSLPLRAAYKIIHGGTSAWIFATLPLRPGWVVRNVIDNFAKTLMAGVHDPRAYFVGSAEGNLIRSIFMGGAGHARRAAHFMDGLFGTHVGTSFDDLLGTVWMHPEEVLGKLFSAHGITVPEDVLRQSRLNVFEQKVASKGSLRTSIKPELFADKELGDQARAYLKLSEEGRIAAFKDRIWEVMANTPEDYFKRVIYRDQYKKAIERGLKPTEAHDLAWAKVVDTLFDYSKISVVEDNLRVFMPFIQFWRKNTGFWVKTFATNPWLPYQIQKLEEARREAHKDWPEWMRRYVSVTEVTDATAVVPGLGWLAEHALPQQGQYDPLNFFSFAPLYRVYADKVLGVNNPNLPSDEKASRFGGFFGSFLDAMNDWGLGVNPFLRKPLESAGIANYRSWQTIFPETGLAEALTHKFYDDNFRLTDWERIFTLGLGKTPSDQIAENFDQYVNMEIAGQAARGEPTDRAKAENTIKAWFWEQNLYGFFTGVYYRKNTPEDFYLSKMHDEVVNGQRSLKDMSEADRKLEALWQHRKLDRLSFDRYVETYPLIQAYYRQPDYASAQAFAREHPEVVKYVDPILSRGKPFSPNYVKAAGMYLRGQEFFDVRELAKRAGLSPDTISIAVGALVTPEIKAFWAKNDTPAKERATQIKAELYRHLTELSEAYHAIPDSDHAAKDGFLKEHPDLELYWQMNNSEADDYRSVIQHANADLRERYFEIVREKGFAAGAPFLKAHPFMFQWTTAAPKIDAKTGTWLPSTPKGKAYVKAQDGIQHYHDLADKDQAAANKWLHSDDPNAKLAIAFFQKYSTGSKLYEKAKPWLDHYDQLKKNGKPGEASAWLRGGSPGAKIVTDFFEKYADKGKGNTQYARDYVAAKKYLDHYFYLRDHVSKQAAYNWLDQKGEGQALVQSFFDKYANKSGQKTDYARAYLRAKPWLVRYFAMPEDVRGKWLDGGSEGAKIVIDFFENHAHHNGLSAQAKAWLPVKDDIKRYFAMTKAERKKWLASGDPAAARVLDYFKRFSKSARLERAFIKNHPDLASGDPELNRRLVFWAEYFKLPPDRRPGFVHQFAEEYGVYVYGAHGETHARDREQKWLRKAVTLGGLSKRAATYLYVKPLLDQFNQLPKGEQRDLFLRANPELADYFKQYADNGPSTGDKKLDAAIEAYFKLPADSPARSTYLKAHPKVQDYFDAHSAPAQRAIHSLLEIYFGLPLGDRAAYREAHPEISLYFDKRRADKAATDQQLSAFEQADPSLKPFFAQSEVDLIRAAENQRAKLRQAHIARFQPKEFTRRTERQPLRGA